jgi:hypothetical protein
MKMPVIIEESGITAIVIQKMNVSENWERCTAAPDWMYMMQNGKVKMKSDQQMMKYKDSFLLQTHKYRGWRSGNTLNIKREDRPEEQYMTLSALIGGVRCHH